MQTPPTSATRTGSIQPNSKHLPSFLLWLLSTAMASNDRRGGMEGKEEEDTGVLELKLTESASQTQSHQLYHEVAAVFSATTAAAITTESGNDNNDDIDGQAMVSVKPSQVQVASHGLHPAILSASPPRIPSQTSRTSLLTPDHVKPQPVIPLSSDFYTTSRHIPQPIPSIASQPVSQGSFRQRSFHSQTTVHAELEPQYDHHRR